MIYALAFVVARLLHRGWDEAAMEAQCAVMGNTGFLGGMVAAAALPVEGNTYILARHFNLAPRRVTAAILISTAASVATVTAVIAVIAS